MTLEAKCNCSRASDDASVNMNEHETTCARVIEWREYQSKAFIIDHKRVLCPVHGMPFQAQWPLGFAVFAVKIFEVVTGVPGIWDEALRLARPAKCTTDEPCASCLRNDGSLCLMSSETDVTPYRLGVKALEPVLDARPACCRISPDKLVELYREARIGKKGRCRFCGRMQSWGTPITASNTGPLKHVCFDCISTASSTPHTQS